jgi:aarF domain-containing kinase
MAFVLLEDKADAKEIAVPRRPVQSAEELEQIYQEAINEVRKRRPEGLKELHPLASDLALSIFEPIALAVRALHIVVRALPLGAMYLYCRWQPAAWPRWYSLLRSTLEALGPCWIKLGQWAATRRDLFPDDVVKELSRLHTQAPEHGQAATEAIMEQVYGAPLRTLFSFFEQAPMASGAIAQVYRAQLRGATDGPLLAIKVRHPGVEISILRDLRLLRAAVWALGGLAGFSSVGLPASIDAFRGRMLAQIDLRVEAENLQRFQRNFSGADTAVRFPTPLLPLCAPAVLVETFEDGLLFSDFLATNPPVALRKRLASIGCAAFLKMILQDDFAHADLHPGNILFDREREQLVMLDAGLVAPLTPVHRAQFQSLFKAIVDGDAKGAAKLMTLDQPHLPPQEVDAFSSEMENIIQDVVNSPIDKVDVGKVFSQILNTARIHGVHLESQFSTMVLGAAVLEGIGRQLDQDLNFIQEAKPFLQNDPELRNAYIRNRLRAAGWGHR